MTRAMKNAQTLTPRNLDSTLLRISATTGVPLVKVAVVVAHERPDLRPAIDALLTRLT